MAKVLGLGYVVLDVWSGAPGLRTCVGGSTANTLALLAHFGHSAELLGAVGTDPAGRQCLEELATLGVGVDRVLRRSGKRTKQIHVEVGGDGDRHFRIVRGNVAAAPSRSEIRSLGVAAQDVDIYHSALSTLGSLDLARSARWASYNGQRCYGRRDEVHLHRRVLAASDVVVMSQGYLAAVLRLRGTQPVPAGVLAELGGPALRVVTLGSGGSVAWFQGRLLGTPAVDLSARSSGAVDTTGAGDAFHAGLLHRLVTRVRCPGRLAVDDVADACGFASQVAAFACCRYGTRNALAEAEYAKRLGDAPPSREIDADTPLFCPGPARAAMCSGTG